MKLNRVIAGVVVAATAVLGLTACTSEQGTGAAVQDSSLNKVLTNKKLVVGVFADAPPYGVMNSSGEYEGFDIDAARALASSLGAEIEFVSTTNANRIPLLETGKVDIVIAALTNLDERAQKVAMSRPYAAEGQVVLVPAASDITSYDDLAGRTVAATRGSVPATILETRFPEAKASLFEAVADSIQALRSGKVDALMESNSVAGGILKDSSGEFVEVNAPQLSPSVVSMGVKLGDQLWLNYVNNFVQNYNISDAANASYNKWLNTDVPELIK
ncbi:transporter substrate-binding domain-containing protein [Microbacterium sp. 5K110]|jgi:polar amino acid transport system substrate-binding protein|uniref:transporter substrate-binding domain-containing protein n=1 Tax=unclassified Microbacterium TaxID=2609290 RepID=UPI0010FE92B4|nr:transporter substrate-binding domain-containing protein [Microbacterium sp. 5K110]TLF30071.1 transporter substrate-binding domain-containing protein [Microbacterium sp. 5K110]